MNSNKGSSSSNSNNSPRATTPSPRSGGENLNTRTLLRPQAILGVPTLPRPPTPTLPPMPLLHHSPSHGAFSYYHDRMLVGGSGGVGSAGSPGSRKRVSGDGDERNKAERLAEEETIAASVERRRGIKIDLNIDLIKDGAASDDDAPDA